VKHVLVLAVAIAGCGKGKSKDECRAEATAVGDLLVEAAKEPAGPLVVRDEVQLVKRTDLPPRPNLARAPVVTLTPATILVDDKPATDVAALRVQLTDAGLQLAADRRSTADRGAHDRERMRVYFMIDPATRWDRVVTIVDEAAAAGYSWPIFVFEQPPALMPPPRSPIDDKLDAILKTEPNNRASEVARLASKLVEKCSPLAEEFGRVTGDPGENKALTISRAVKPALIACNCDVNIPELRSVLFRVLFVPRPLRVVMFDNDATAVPIQLAPDATWAEASKRFTPTLKNADLLAL
jgi:hypothetical protein